MTQTGRRSDEVTPLNVFYNKLACHDWHYGRSDDFNVWIKGSRVRLEIERISRESEDHRRLYRQFRRYAVYPKKFSRPCPPVTSSNETKH